MLYLMSGYNGQKKPYISGGSTTDGIKVIAYDAYRLMRSKLDDARRGSAYGNFILAAAADPLWRIEFERVDKQVLDYDTHVGRMWQDLESGVPLLHACGALVARSLGIDHIGDGR